MDFLHAALATIAIICTIDAVVVLALCSSAKKADEHMYKIIGIEVSDK